MRHSWHTAACSLTCLDSFVGSTEGKCSRRGRIHIAKIMLSCLTRFPSPVTYDLSKSFSVAQELIPKYSSKRLPITKVDSLYFSGKAFRNSQVLGLSLRISRRFPVFGKTCLMCSGYFCSDCLDCSLIISIRSVLIGFIVYDHF